MAHLYPGSLIVYAWTWLDEDETLEDAIRRSYHHCLFGEGVKISTLSPQTITSSLGKIHPELDRLGAIAEKAECEKVSVNVLFEAKDALEKRLLEFSR